jgi:hypothetical protein
VLMARQSENRGAKSIFLIFSTDASLIDQWELLATNQIARDDLQDTVGRLRCLQG